MNKLRPRKLKLTVDPSAGKSGPRQCGSRLKLVATDVANAPCFGALGGFEQWKKSLCSSVSEKTS